MPDKKDYYDILNVSKNATAEEIKSAYRKKALEWHPDKHQGTDKKAAEEKFKGINEAYQVLSDPQKKSAYDQFGHAAFEQGGMGQGPFTYTYYTNGGSDDFSSQGRPASDWDFGGFSDPFEIFEQFFGTASPFGGRRTPRRKTYSLTIDFIEAVSGVQKEVVIDGKKSTIKIPAGVEEGSRVRFGDFDVVVEVSPSKIYKREGDDLIKEEIISFSQAALGGILEMETIDGKEKLRIHAGTQPGTIIRLRAKGVSHVRGGGRGDLYVRLNIKVPEKLTNRQKELLRELEKAGKERSGWF